MSKPNKAALLELGFEALVEHIGGPGRAAAIMRALRRGEDPRESSELGKRTLRVFNECCVFEPPPLEHIEEADDGTLKAVLRFDDQARIETVLIPTTDRTTLCVSSQVGCSRQCQFCMTAEMGMMRQLSVTEILMQVWWAQRIVRERNYPNLRNVVFMGMGEPLDNWPSVEPAIRALTDQRMQGFGARHVTLSTVGPSAEKIKKLKGLPCKLAWSIHATHDEQRRGLIPTQRQDLSELIEAFETVVASRKDSLFLEYTLIRDLNDSEEDAEDLASLALRFGSETRVNLLPVNPGRAEMFPPEDEQCLRFAEILKSHGVLTMLRLARGQDQTAACGQLIQRLKKKRADGQSARFTILENGSD